MACSICRLPGHNKNNCPNVELVRRREEEKLRRAEVRQLREENLYSRIECSSFVVVNVQTTGLEGCGRVIEIALVGLDTDCGIEWTWHTLINPQQSDMGRTDIHRIFREDVVDAPTFRDVAGHIVASLRGRVIVAHNTHFHARFLHDELGACGIESLDP